nr:hypothetical protein [Tanacetum cinerariifolium]
QLPQRSNKDIRLEMVKLIKNNRILLNDNVFPHEEVSMEVLLAKERMLKLIQAWDEKQIESLSLPALLLQLLNDSRTINEMLKQREQAANLAVQKKQEEQAVQSFTPNWKFSIINNDEEHSIQYKEYLENSLNAIAPVLPIKEPEYSLSMRYEHLCTIPETESDEVIKSSVKNLVPILSEYEVTFDDENFKFYSNPLFDDEEISSDKIDLHYFNIESDFIESLSNRDTLFDSSPKFDYLEEFSGELMPINSCPRPSENFHANTIDETLPTSPILVEDSDSFREEIDIFTGTDDLLPQSIKSDGYDSEGNIYFLEELLVDDSTLIPEIESSNFDHHDDSPFPRPPSEPLDVEFFFNLEPNSGELISAVMNNINELNEEECFKLGGKIDGFANVEDDNYFPFIFVIQNFLPYLIYPEVSPLLLSTGSEDIIFYHGIST